MNLPPIPDAARAVIRAAHDDSDLTGDNPDERVFHVASYLISSGYCITPTTHREDTA